MKLKSDGTIDSSCSTVIGKVTTASSQNTTAVVLGAPSISTPGPFNPNTTNVTIADTNAQARTLCISVAAQVQPPINPDGSSIFNVKRGVVPVKFTLTVDGAPTCDLPSATISLFRTSGGALGMINEST